MSYSMKFFSILPAVLLAFTASEARAQDGPPAEVSSMQWANASAAEGIKFTLLGDVVANPWRAGGQVGAGRRETLQWATEFAPASGSAPLKVLLELKPGQSGAAVLVGDFAEKDDAASSSSSALPPGYSKTDSGKLLRAALLRFPVGKLRESQYPVHLVNADPENRVKVTAAGTTYDLEYSVPKSFKAPAGEHVKVKVSALGLEKEMGFTLEPNQRGGILAFYRPVDGERTSFVFVNLRSIESIKEMVAPQSGEPEPSQ
jgi:hypothetical protein